MSVVVWANAPDDPKTSSSPNKRRKVFFAFMNFLHVISTDSYTSRRILSGSEPGVDPLRDVIVKVLHHVGIRSTGARRRAAGADPVGCALDGDEIFVDALGLSHEIFAVAHEIV